MSFLKTDKSNLVEPKVKTTPQNVAESNDIDETLSWKKTPREV